MRQLLSTLILGVLSGCADYASYPAPYGYPHPSSLNYGSGAYTAPSYAYYPGPVYYGHSYGWYGNSDYDRRPPISNDQKARNYLYDHRSQIQRLPPQQQREVLREANKIMRHPHSYKHHSE